MLLTKLVPLVLQLSLVLVVFGLGLRARLLDVTGFWRRPALVARSLLALNVIVPVVVVLAAIAFDPIRPVKLALVLLAISPVPPFLPKKQLKLSQDRSYIAGLLVTTSLLAILYVPIAVSLLGAAVDRSLSVPASLVLKIVALSVLGPLAAGMLVRRAGESFAERIQPFVAKAGIVLLLLALVFVLGGTWQPMLALIGNGTVLVIAVVVMLGLLVGHLLGGPNPEDRAVLALAASSHHPAVASAIAAAILPDERSISAAVLLYLLLNGILSVPYTAWRKRTRVQLISAPPHLQALHPPHLVRKREFGS